MEITPQSLIDNIHCASSSNDLFENIAQATQSLLNAQFFQLYFIDDQTGNLNLYYSNKESAKEFAGIVAERLQQDLLPSEQINEYLATNQDFNEATKLVAAYKLQYQNMVYGCLTVHADQIDQDHAWVETFRKIGNAINPEIIKIQLLESASSEAHLSQIKLQGIHSSIDLIHDVDLDTVLIKLMGLALKTMAAEVGSIMILDNNQLKTKTDFGFSEDVAQLLKTKNGEKYIDHVINQEDATLILNTEESDLINTTNLKVNLSSIISVPLRTKKETLGLLHIINNEKNFDQNNYEVLKTVCNLSSYALQNAILYKEQMENERLKESMKIAQNIHASLLQIPHLMAQNIEIFGWTQACDETGGDYFDLIELNESRMEVVVGDASGHGIGAALTMLITRSSLKTLYQQNLPLDYMFNILNNRLSADTTDEKFMTLFCGSINPQTNVLSYCSAGHDGPLLIREGQEMRELDSTGIPLGMMPDYAYETSEGIQLIKGDILILGSDGTWEAMNQNKEVFGKERIIKIAKDNNKKTAKEINIILQAEIRKFIGNEKIRDDMTLIILKVNNDTVSFLKKAE